MNKGYIMKYGIIVALSVIVILIGVLAFNLLKEEYISEVVQCPQNRLDLKQFLGIIKKQEYFYSQIYYVPFSAESTGNLTESFILNAPFLKLTIGGAVPFYHTYIGNALSDFSFSKQKDLPQYNTFHYCFLVKSKSDKYIRFSIASPSFGTMFINGQPYEASPELIDAFLKLLPARDYEKAAKYIQETRMVDKSAK